MPEATESDKYVHLVAKYLRGNGVDVGCGAKPVITSAIAFDLQPASYAHYHSGLTPDRVVQWGGDCHDLPFKDGTCDYCYSSHLLEDFLNWTPLLKEWGRVVKPAGFLVILIPDRDLWNAAIARGQPPNCEHKHEGRVGELTQHINAIGGWRVIEDRLTNAYPKDYSILFVAQKL